MTLTANIAFGDDTATRQVRQTANVLDKLSKRRRGGQRGCAMSCTPTRADAEEAMSDFVAELDSSMRMAAPGRPWA